MRRHQGGFRERVVRLPSCMAGAHETTDGASLQGEAREAYVEAMFDRISAPYDRLNRIISLGRDPAWRRLAVKMGAIGPGSRVLDLGTGTGDLAEIIAETVGPEGRVLGLDLSEGMLSVARVKLKRRGFAHASVRKGNARETGETADAWDAVTMGWVLRNVGDRPATYEEILRVLKPGGRLVVLDCSKPDNPIMRFGFWIYLRTVMPLLIRFLHGDGDAYRYLKESTEKFLTPNELTAELTRAGFSKVVCRKLMGGSMAIHVATR